MVIRAGILAASLALAGCFDFQADLRRCEQDRRCPLADGGFFVRTEGLCAQGVCWEHPYPTGVPLTALHAAGPNDFWAGGAGGVVVHLKGAQAEIAYLGRPVPPAVDWSPITGLATCSTGPSAVARNRRLFTFTPSGVVPVLLDGVTSRSTAVAGWTSPEGTCAFLGSESQAIWVGEERGGKLANLGSPPDSPPYYRVMTALGGTDARDLWLASDRDVFARGDDGGFDLDRASLPDGGLPGLTGICSLGGGEVFASSARGIRARALGWGPMGGEEALTAVACLSSGEVVATGAGRIRRCTFGGSCSDLDTPETWTRAAAVGELALVASSAGDVALASPTGDALSRLSSGIRQDLLDVAVSPGGETWAAGRAATLLRRTQTSWEWVDAGFAATENLNAVTVLSDGRVVVGASTGGMRVLYPDGRVDKPKYYDASNRLIQNQALGQPLYRVREAAGVVWALGGRGVLMREQPDGTWVLQSGTEPYGILDLASNEAGVTWYTGEGGLIYEAQQPTGPFTSIRGPFSSYSLSTILVASSGDVWFGGRDGMVLQRRTDGTLVNHRMPFISPGPDDVRGFVEQPGDAIYAVGVFSLYRFTGVGTNWEILGPLPLDVVSNAIRAVGARGDDFWVVGGKGAILRVNRAQWLRPQ